MASSSWFNRFWVGHRSAIIRSTSFIDEGDDFSREVFVNQDTEGTPVDDREENRVPVTSNGEKTARGTEAEGSINGLYKDESNDSIVNSCRKVPQMVSYLLKYKMMNLMTLLIDIV